VRSVEEVYYVVSEIVCLCERWPLFRYFAKGMYSDVFEAVELEPKHSKERLIEY
jgi:hypothetical protein